MLSREGKLTTLIMAIRSIEISIGGGAIMRLVGDRGIANMEFAKVTGH